MYKDLDLAILAGGGSTRMGIHKGNLTIDGRSFVDYIIYEIGHLFANVNVIDNGLQNTKLPGVNYYNDPLILQTKSSLLGVYSALYYSKNPQTFIIGCDTPLVNKKIVEYIISQRDRGDIVVCMAKGRFQPLYGIYNQKILPRVKETLLQDLHKIKIILDEFNTYYIPEEELRKIDKEMDFIKNFNYFSDYQRYLGEKGC
ncbi:molybdopterin-guanine dinucleotide biosynthesis protein A [Anaerobranca californiensis DSM 14826]|jgi:molybdopterin-guanine dinucleotide biosynthesis protein A|uniref:Molybdopterin-guanine dinucleotide biosynthesis protein A n=1 Tax=Anaerobranca californiensis DSM 14826 TaxID=1120989 RepID=A0A1M6PCK7_9FIRM|nr:molybdenum cofactor guanylyltransferase [Anaerobranca californiensis]SHK05676.1 molybdopterin-guanine dinucleotide biosynthesis protein A [Anaerobranca californiensis DSM 14826]